MKSLRRAHNDSFQAGPKPTLEVWWVKTSDFASSYVVELFGRLKYNFVHTQKKKFFGKNDKE